MYHLDPRSPQPLHVQLYEAIRSDIIARHAVGDKLPSIRKIAQQYNLSKTTVESAYSQLYAEGYIESRPRSGYYVGDYRLDVARSTPVPTPPAKEPEGYRYDFFPAQLHRDDFPRKLWKRLCAQTLNDHIDMGAYPDGQGESALREQIAAYLGRSRGAVCSADQIVITHGFADSMELLAKILRGHYHGLGIESPGYHLAWKAFAGYGYGIEHIPVDSEGIGIDALRKSRAQVIYVTPSHQYPTGVAMPISRRQQILAYAREVDGLIIEDDYDSELTYATRPIPSLQGIDSEDRVVYLGTLAKSLSPAIRLGYMVLPRRILPLYRRSYDVYFARVSLLTQLTLERFIAEGHYERHLRRIRTQSRKKHDRMLELFAQYLGESYEVLASGGGLSIHIMPTVPFDWERFFAEAKHKRIKLYMARERSGGKYEAIRMGFGGFSLSELEEAVAAFGEAWGLGVRK